MKGKGILLGYNCPSLHITLSVILGPIYLNLDIGLSNWFIKHGSNQFQAWIELNGGLADPCWTILGFYTNSTVSESEGPESTETIYWHEKLTNTIPPPHHSLVSLRLSDWWKSKECRSLEDVVSFRPDLSLDEIKHNWNQIWSHWEVSRKMGKKQNYKTGNEFTIGTCHCLPSS